MVAHAHLPARPSGSFFLETDLSIRERPRILQVACAGQWTFRNSAS